MGRKRIIVGASGASGTPLLMRCLEEIAARPDYEAHVILTEGARLTARQEAPGALGRIEELATCVYAPEQIGAGPASGSFPALGMLVVPCSMKTVAGIAAGYADNLLLRAADVAIKEQRPLVLAARETPLSAIHLRNLSTVAALPGVRVIPPMMTFYHNPTCIDDMVRHIACKLLRPFGIEADGSTSWEGIA